MNDRLGTTWVAVLGSKMRCVAPILAIGGIFFAMAQPRVLAQRFFYRFTPIVDTAQGFPISDLETTFPCQNNENRVAFYAPFGDSYDIFTSLNLGPVQSIADSTSLGYSGLGLTCSINDKGTVLFTAYDENNMPVELISAAGTQPQTLLSTGGTYSGFEGVQLNNQGKAVVLAERSDSTYVILTKVAGGSEKIIATTSSGSPYASFSSVSINSSGTVAFVAGRPDGSSGVFPVPENGTAQMVAEIGSPGYFNDIDLNDEGSVAFDGEALDGTATVWRADNPGTGYVTTKITDASMVDAAQFDAVSINSSGQVSSFFEDPIGNYNVAFGDGRLSLLSPIVVQPNMYVLGRIVSFGTVGQDSLNDSGQIVVEIGFIEGSSVIALAQVVDALPNPRPPVTVIGLSTATGTSAGVHTSVNLASQLAELAFDATFITKQGELKITLGDKLLKTIPAGARGVRQSIRIPIDLRVKHRPTAPPLPRELKFQLTGKPGAVVQIGNIRIPEAGLMWNPRVKNSRWHFDTRSGGWGSLVDATRFPVEIKLLSQDTRQNSTAGNGVSVAILSTKSFDATKDIERDALHFGGMPVRSERDAKGNEHLKCAERDVNGDERADLVCEFETPAATAASAQKSIRLLEGMTPYGWIVEGRME
jgi:hypothetical protein